MRWLLLSLALAVASVNSQERPPDIPRAKPHSAKTNRKPEAEKQGTEKTPLVVKRIDAEETAERRAQMRAERDEKAANERSMVKWTIVLSGATITLALIAAIQVGFFVWQLKLMAKATKDAGRAATAARDSVNTQLDTARKELRAYLGIGGGELYRLPDGVLRGTVIIKNFGETPAHNVQPAITGDFRKPGDEHPFPDPDFIPHKQPIAPTMHWEFGHEFRDRTQQDVNDVYARGLLVYIWGRVKYDDIYGEPHILRFRFRNVVTSLVTIDGHTGIERWYYYPEEDGNEAT